MRILQHYRDGSGQGILEVVLVVVLFGAAVAVAVPAYLGFQGRKADKTAQANLVAAAQMAEAYRADHGSYLGMNGVELALIDPRLATSVAIAWTKRRSYCLTDTVHGKTWSVRGPYRSETTFAENGTCE